MRWRLTTSSAHVPRCPRAAVVPDGTAGGRARGPVCILASSPLETSNDRRRGLWQPGLGQGARGEQGARGPGYKSEALQASHRRLWGRRYRLAFTSCPPLGALGLPSSVALRL